MNRRQFIKSLSIGLASIPFLGLVKPEKVFSSSAVVDPRNSASFHIANERWSRAFQKEFQEQAYFYRSPLWDELIVKGDRQ